MELETAHLNTLKSVFLVFCSIHFLLPRSFIVTAYENKFLFYCVSMTASYIIEYGEIGVLLLDIKNIL